MDVQLFLLLPLGVAAGVITTLAGVGGGMMLVLIFSMLEGPAWALTVTAPALLVGNLHRMVLFWADIHRKVALLLVLGVLPGALWGGSFALALSPLHLHGALLVVTALTLGRELGFLRFTLPRRSVLPVAFGAGVAGAITGGAGLLVAPLLLAMGVKGAPYIATGAAFAFAMHIGRLGAYSHQGAMTPTIWASALVLGTTVLLGNHLGKSIRLRLSERTLDYITYSTLSLCIVLAIFGVAH